MSGYGLTTSPTRAPHYQKDVSDTVDISMSWHHLGSDTITTSTWTSEGLTVRTDSVEGLVTTVFVSGGTEGEVTNLTNTVVTGMGRTLERTVYVAVSQL